MKFVVWGGKMEICKICKREMIFVKPYGEGSHIKYWQCPNCMWKKY